MNVQTARANPDHRWTWLSADELATLFVEVGERSAQSLKNVFYAQPLVLPLVYGRIFEIQHHPRCARTEHFHHELGGTGRAAHRITLIPTPFRQTELPAIADSHATSAIRGLFSTRGRNQRA